MQYKKSLIPVFLCLAALISTGCKEQRMVTSVPLKEFKDLPPGALEQLAKKTIYFGHQSVGGNIIDGIRDLQAQKAIPPLNIKEIPRGKDIEKGSFSHSKIGKNDYPDTKIDAFQEILADMPAGLPDIAIMKFCYVDITFETDVEAVLDSYLRAMQGLEAKYPDTLFVYVSAPLTTYKTGFFADLKNLVKKIMGKPRHGLDDNLVRFEFNRKLAATLPEKAHFFDLATLEATGPEGQMIRHHKKEGEFQSLVPIYARDGGHLNEAGRQFIARQLLIFLSTL